MLKIISTYTLTQYINKGEYGKVYKAIDHTTHQYVAIKMISLDKFIQKSKLIELTKQEVQILNSLDKNPNIIKLKEIIKSNRFLYLVYEFCQGGTLEQLCNRNGPMPQKQAIKLFKQLINAYRSLYESNIVHRDIKPDNIFFKNNTLKLADFGFCKQLKFTDDLTQTSLGSPLYMAPEVLNNDVYGSKADLWSCGIILYQMLFGVTPYGTCNMKELLIQYGVKQQVPIPQEKKYISPVLVEMLRRMLCKDQFRRISWQDFFYEYKFSENGTIKHQQKDFEYDLMKLMKRNSSGQPKSVDSGYGNNKFLRFDWSKITQMNSSVHSEQCSQQVSIRNETQNYGGNLSRHRNTTENHDNSHYRLSHSLSVGSLQTSQQQQITQLYMLKKAIKHFQNQHSKIYELLTITQSLLQSTKPHEYDSRVVYFLIYNVQHLLKTNIRQVQQHLKTNERLMNTLPEEKNKLERLKRIFEKEHQDSSLKINSIKTALITLEQVQGQLFRYPRKDVMRRVMKEYIDNYELEVCGVLEMTRDGRTCPKQDTVRMLKVLWGVNIVYATSDNQPNSQTTISDLPQRQKLKYWNLVSIKEETTERQVSALVNRLLVELGI